MGQGSVDIEKACEVPTNIMKTTSTTSSTLSGCSAYQYYDLEGGAFLFAIRPGWRRSPIISPAALPSHLFYAQLSVCYVPDLCSPYHHESVYLNCEPSNGNPTREVQILQLRF